MDEHEHDPPPLRVTDICFGYVPGQQILTGFTQDFNAGEVVAITGESGRGKSTLLYILGLLLKQTSGNVLVAGKNVNRFSDLQRSYFRASHFGFVFQDAALDGSRSIIDNVCESALYRGQTASSIRGNAIKLLGRFGVGLRLDAKPGQVSGGQAQRIALARALVHNPPVLLCDEPTGNLDGQSAAVVIEAIRDHAKAGGVAIVVTHSPEVVEQCDREVRL